MRRVLDAKKYFPLLSFVSLFLGAATGIAYQQSKINQLSEDLATRNGRQIIEINRLYQTLEDNGINIKSSRDYYALDAITSMSCSRLMRGFFETKNNPYFNDGIITVAKYLKNRGTSIGEITSCSDSFSEFYEKIDEAK